MSIDPLQRIALSRHADLKTRKGADILVLPERALQIGGSGAEILRVVGDGRLVSETIRIMREGFPETDEIESVVLAFLDEMLKLGGIVRVHAHDRNTP